jgi:RimJ/RimL family protein N-acetyltransferase
VDRFKLRYVTDSDHVWLCELHNDPLVLNNVTHPESITLDQHMSWWQKVSNDSGQLRFVFTVDDVAAGFVKFYDVDHTNMNCVLGADLHKSFRGEGLAKEMWRLMLDFAFNQLWLYRVGLTTASFNHIAKRTYDKLGFIEEGKLTNSLFRDGKFHDQIMMYMLRDWWKERIANETT